MEIVLLLLTLLCFAAILSSRRESRPTLASAPGLPVSDDGLVSLPSPDAKTAYSEMASAAEMQFAGHYLNLVGLAMLGVGILSYLKVSGVTARATSGGFLQCLLGLSVGLFLSWAGDRLHRQGQRTYAHPLLAGGIAILTVTIATAYFYFHLIPLPVLALACFAIVSWSGLAAMRYDSAPIGICMLASVFLGPLVMGFPFPSSAVALGYLLAINAAITVVAYHKKWNLFLIASLAGSYLLYFSQFGLSDPRWAMAFLSMTYAMFLVSDNIFHFVRRTASDFNLAVSMVNPLLFACVSYTVLWQLNNTLAVLLYTVIAVLHASLANHAAKLEGQAEAYVPMARANLALSMLFATAAVSFLTYFSNATGTFALVTVAWFGLGFALLQLSRRLPADYSSLARYGSYGAMMLTSAQLTYVVPTMQQPLAIQLPALLALLAYFHLHEKESDTREERLFSNLVLISALIVFAQTLPFPLYSIPGLLTGTTLVPLGVIASRRYPTTLACYRAGAPVLGVLMVVLTASFPWPPQLASLALPLVAAILASLTVLDKEDDNENGAGVLMAVLILLRGCALLSSWGTGLGLAAATVVLFGFHQVSRQMKVLEPLVLMLAMVLGGVTLITPVDPIWGLLVTVLITTVIAAIAISDDNLPLGTVTMGLAALQGMKLVFLLQSGPGSTLLWCLLGLAVLHYAPQFELAPLAVMFLAFLKSIVFDANFTVGRNGLELAHSAEPRRLVLVGAVIACYAVAARLAKDKPEMRNFYSLFGLLVFAFQTTFLLFFNLATLDNFQIILSGFWAAASLLFIAYGIHAENKLFRLFGLVVLVSCALKIYAVDIWVLDAYSKTTTTLIMGSLLMAVSFLYQTNRTRLVQEGLCPA